MYQVIIVEDDPMVAEIDKQYVEHNNKMNIAGVFQNGQDALEFCRNNPVDLIMLDYYMPVMDGRTFLTNLRAEGILADVIMVTAASEASRVSELYSYGVSDYLIKPFSPRELVARVRALLRRAHSDAEPQLEVLDFGDLIIDVSGHKVTVEKKEVELTASEFKLLTTLARYPGRVYTRMELVEKVLGYDFEGYERTIDSHVKNLRAKLGDDPKKPKWLYTVHGVGYRFEGR